MISNSLGSSAYFGAQFADDVVVFENINFGNAAYVLYEGWKEMSKLSRTELLRDENSFDRIVHSKGWEKRLGICHSSRTGKISVKKFWGCVAKAANRSPDPPPKKTLEYGKGPWKGVTDNSLETLPHRLVRRAAAGHRAALAVRILRMAVLPSDFPARHIDDPRIAGVQLTGLVDRHFRITLARSQA